MTTVATTTGALRGCHGNGIVRFLGIRYGAPPTGPRRFLPPERADAHRGIADAFESGPAAPQRPPRGLALPPTMAEDCLFLDVYTPGLAGGGRPVMVWFHGGSFRFGWPGDFDGAALAQVGDVVVVTVGYRLGLLGFAALGHIDAAYAGSSNAGIADQVAALQWVRDNAETFGGDPANVTVFGQSAGGESVAALLAAPAADGLFHRAIVQSATVAIPSLGDRQRAIVERAAAALGSRDDALGRLAAATVDEVLTAQELATDITPPRHALARPDEVDIFPSVDGAVIATTPVEAMRSRGSSGPPLIIGTTRHEGTLLDGHLEPAEPDETSVRRAFAEAGIDPDDALAAYRELRPDGSWRDVLVDSITDTLVRTHSLRLADTAATAGSGSWVYLVTWETDARRGRLGATHGVDLPMLWDAPNGGRWSRFLGSRSRPGAVADRMQRAWTSFARCGAPGGGEPHWPAYDPSSRWTLVFGEHVATVPDPDAATRRLWESSDQRTVAW